MPSPAVGGGAAVSKGKQRYQSALSLAAPGSGATYPADKLGATSEPTGGWVRQGRLLDDTFAWSIGDMEWLNMRAGFTRSLQHKVPRQAEDITLTFRLDEADPDVQAKLRGTTATSLSAGTNTGQEYVYKTGSYYAAKVLMVDVSPTTVGTRERHLYSGSAIVTFKPAREDEYEGLDVQVTFLDVDSTETFRYREWN